MWHVLSQLHRREGLGGSTLLPLGRGVGLTSATRGLSCVQPATRPSFRCREPLVEVLHASTFSRCRSGTVNACCFMVAATFINMS